MAEPIVIPAGRPAGPRERARVWLRGRRLTLAALLAVIEIIVVLVGDPGFILGTLVAGVVLVLAVMLASRLRPGILRDALWIVAIAQAMVVFVPLLLGVTFAAALLFAVVLLVGVLIVALRFRL